MCVLISITIYLKKKKNRNVYPTLVVCLVSVVYNPSLQLQKLNPFVIVLWLCNVL